jgi:O-acetyl-ADP-ribose deacetylase (regulator of RNase III)
MRWTIKHGNIIDESADALICSANVMLNLSGGVGADLLGRYGLAMQKELHEIVNARNPMPWNEARSSPMKAMRFLTKPSFMPSL